jgi:hypothetical protein
MPKRGDMVSALRVLKAAPAGEARRTLHPEEAVEMIRAYRRGVPLEAIAAASGRGRGNIYASLGTWALRYAQLPDKD